MCLYITWPRPRSTRTHTHFPYTTLYRSSPMSFLSLALFVLAALVHATWNLLAKRAAHAGVAFVFAYNLVSTIAYAPWVAWVLLTEGMAWSGAAVGFIFLSALIHLAYSLCLQRGYQVADLSVV